MTAALIAAAILLALAIPAIAVVTRELIRGKDRQIADKERELQVARSRIAHLELTIDEIRARELSTTMPPPAVVQPERPPLPAVIQERLAEVDDPTGELEELARARIEADPDADPDVIADELFV